MQTSITADPPAAAGRPGQAYPAAADRWAARVAAAFADAVESGRLNLPLPGGGRTRERWADLADLAGCQEVLFR